MLHSRLKGRDLHAPTNELVENGSGSTIPKMRVVHLEGLGTVYPQVELANPDQFVNFGITYDDMLPGKTGLVCAFGFMFEVDTSAWPVFTLLYSDASGNLTTSVNGGIVAQVIKQDAEFGILYVITETNNSINSISWRLDGNAGLNPAQNFLGTKDAVPLRIRTNNLLRATVDADGRLGLGPDLTDPLSHFHQKSHVGFAGSGLQQETFSLMTAANTPQAIYSVPIENLSVVKIEVSALARIEDGSGRAAFTREGLFYRENSNVQAQRVWSTPFTEKSDPNFDISYSMTVNELIIMVKSSVNTDTYWTGHIKIEALKTNE